MPPCLRIQSQVRSSQRSSQVSGLSAAEPMTLDDQRTKLHKLEESCRRKMEEIAALQKDQVPSFLLRPPQARRGGFVASYP